LKALCGWFRIVIENFFKAHDLATAAQAAHVRARVRDRQTSSTVDRVSQRNAADALLGGKFEEFRHRGFSLPSLGPPFSIAVSASKGGFRLRQLTEAEATEADSLDDHFAVSYTKDFPCRSN
jgi:hypothetical protein